MFRIDPTSLNARAEQARAQIGQAAAGADADRAALARARAAYANAAAEAGRTAADLARYQAAERAKTGAVAAQQLDQARIAAQNAARQRDAARDDIAAAQARIAAAQAQVAGTRAGLTDAQRQVTQLSPAAPVSGTVDDTLYQRGEWAPANAPIISLIPDGQVKVRFYVPQGLVDHYRPGTRVAIACDGCAVGMTATVDCVAARPEYTPPMIYSLETRDKLVFMVEALPAAATPARARPADRRSAGGAAAMTAAIDVRGLNKSFGDKHVVRDVSISVEEGRITGFLGPNGSGKTTTLRMLCGLLTPDSGEGTVLGLDFRTRQRARSSAQTGYMTQSFSLYEDLTIEENLRFIARVYALDRRPRAGRRGARTARAERPARPARRRAVGRLEAAPGPGRRDPARAPAAAARRADRRGRPQGAARVLGRDPRAGRRRHDRAGLDPLHGRGRALPRHRLYPLRPADRARHGGRDHRRLGSRHLQGRGPRRSTVWHRALAAQPGVIRPRHSARRSMSAAPTARRSSRPSRRIARAAYHWTEVPASLEDVFIQLMGARDATDSYAA